MPEPVYWEIPSTNVAASAAFYAALFGWKMTPSTDDYVMFEVPGVEGALGGGIERAKEPRGHGLNVYVAVSDIPAALERVKALGGKVLREKTAIGGAYGYWAAFEDPGGCRGVMLWSRT